MCAYENSIKTRDTESERYKLIRIEKMSDNLKKKKKKKRGGDGNRTPNFFVLAQSFSTELYRTMGYLLNQQLILSLHLNT